MKKKKTKLFTKVCGLRQADNMAEIDKLGIDFIGLIFYEKSPRYVLLNQELEAEFIPTKAQKVGVFVNTDPTEILALCKQFQIPIVQLHGQESVAEVRFLRQQGLRVWKAFGVSTQIDGDLIKKMKDYVSLCEYFILDTQTAQFGGSGRSFDWESLQNYTLPQPFFLSGGISLQDAERLQSLDHQALIGIDLNSRFEKQAGIKDVNLVAKFLKQLYPN
ncbi:phosphoribosylanthranilate isomerase [Hugenholtzia roseola]|uniref:phosphoribosylanthranilate isomerase n=1 Tax=Hugenholtzia roseola TaxID=1002 RepID=UPI0004103EBB|nr:phosphoribosylanthranilate isomerase [Hugenholtzia roseola]